MRGYMKIRDAAKRWEISERRVNALCLQGRIEGAVKFGNVWAIPEGTRKPFDNRIKSSEKVTLKNDSMSGVKVGDVVAFGAYPQSDSKTLEPIEWIVLDTDGDKALLVSKAILDCEMYNNSCNSVTWENCTLRMWLNNVFTKKAFTKEEENLIADTVIDNPSNKYFNIRGGNATTDKVFLLSLDEVEKYLTTEEVRYAKPTAYALSRDAYANHYTGDGWYWLRSPGFYPFYAANINSTSRLHLDDSSNTSAFGNTVNHRFISVRPAMWISMSK